LFGGEDFTGEIYPDYEKIRRSLIHQVKAAALFFLILIPLSVLGISMDDRSWQAGEKGKRIESEKKEKPAKKRESMKKQA
jgi:hypothetical protein